MFSQDYIPLNVELFVMRNMGLTTKIGNSIKFFLYDVVHFVLTSSLCGALLHSC